MAMELKIITADDEFLKIIDWNHEEIKKAVEEKLTDYKNLVYTEAQLPEAKKDRANLNKFIQALEAKRKEIKKRCLEPYEKFESQMKEIVALVKEPVELIDTQIKEYEEAEKAEKKAHIEAMFREMGFQDFVTLEKIWNEKWLNKTYSLKSIEDELLEVLHKVGTDVLTIHELPEFSFEALEAYKNNLDLAEAIREGQRLADIQKRKEEAERLKDQQKQEAAAQLVSPEEAVEDIPNLVPDEPERRWIGFRALLSIDEAKILANFMKENNIVFRSI